MQNTITRKHRGSMTPTVLFLGAVLLMIGMAKTAVSQQTGDLDPVLDSSGMLISSGVPSSTATITVTNTDDSGRGSLRQAIADAIAGDTIICRVTGTITLTSGQLVIDKSLTIQGPGASLLSISGNNASRVFIINKGVTATLDRMAIRNGYENDGAGIVNDGILTVSNSTISNNHSAGDYAGGIRNFSTMSVINCTISGNTAQAGDGGIGNNDTMSVTGSTISANLAGGAGGIWNGGSLTITESTIWGNTATGLGGLDYDDAGGAIYNQGGAVIVNNSTISENTAIFGGGIFNRFWDGCGTIYAANSTISGNHGDGIFSDICPETLINSMVVGNSGGDITGNIETASHNLIGDAASSGGIQHGVNGNIVGKNPMLGPLRNNGGPTLTHALLAGSPAINAGDNAFAIGPTDQRGTGFARIVGGTVDIGSFELQIKPAPQW
jgi:hypothetical protein